LAGWGASIPAVTVAPYRAPTPAAPPARDWLGWALVGTPLLAALVQILLPWPLIGALINLCAMLATLVLIGIDARRWNQEATGHVVRAVLLWLFFFPAYVRRRALWGPPNRLPFAILAVMTSLVGSFFHPFAIRDRAQVRCSFAGKTLGEGYDCAVEKTEGSNRVEVCWDLFVTCTNGPGGTGHACGSVSPAATTHVAMPYSSLVGARGCADKVTGAELTNVVVRAE
jgi:hypothetical protein